MAVAGDAIEESETVSVGGPTVVWLDYLAMAEAVANNLVIGVIGILVIGICFWGAAGGPPNWSSLLLSSIRVFQFTTHMV
jgi:hypothetical protein